MLPAADRAAAAPDFFGTEADVQRLQRATDAQALIERAWFLRQRDTPAALAALQALAGRPEPLPPAAAGRAALVRAEAAWLMHRFADAERDTDAADAAFAAAGDAVGQGDAAMMRASLLDTVGGDPRQAALDRAEACYATAGDARRRCLAVLWQACSTAAAGSRDALPEPTRAALQAAAAFDEPGLDAFRFSFEGSLAWDRGDSAATLGLWLRAFDAACSSGMLGSAVTLAENLGIALSILNDHEGAIEWAERALALVGPTGWPYRQAWSRVQAAAVLVGAGRARQARELLQDALPVVVREDGSRNALLVRMALAEACLALDEPGPALRWCDQGLAFGERADHADITCGTLRHRALALSELGRVAEALHDAARALDIAQRARLPQRELTIRHVMAKIAQRHALPAPQGSPHASGAIHHLREALASAGRIAGYAVPPQWLAELSQALEAAGDLPAALAAQREAGDATERVHTRRAEAMASLMLVRQNTERALAEAARQRMRAELLQAQAERDQVRAEAMLAHAGKMVALGRIASAAAHEMAHPVGAIVLLAETLADGPGALPDAAREAARAIGGEAQRLQQFVARLRDVARAEPVQAGPHALPDLLARARALYGPRLATEGRALDEHLPAVWVQADPQRLSLVLANLVFNALDALRETAAGDVAPGAGALVLTAEVSGDTVCLHLDDRGPGLPPAVLARLFEPFFTTKPAGLGLGLALSAASLQAMGGRLAACNRAGGGARFTLTLQRLDPPGAGRAA